VHAFVGTGVRVAGQRVPMSLCQQHILRTPILTWPMNFGPSILPVEATTLIDDMKKSPDCPWKVRL